MSQYFESFWGREKLPLSRYAIYRIQAVCDLRFQMFEIMYENASKIAMNTA